MSERDFLDIQEVLGYQFSDKKMLQRALTHSSYANEGHTVQGYHNERLEFLGDAFFDAIISEELYRQLDDVEEGELTKLRASVVCEKSLAQCAVTIDLGTYLFVGKGEEHSGGRTRSSILADAMEAVIGAMYLDGGWEKVKAFVLRVFDQTIKAALAGQLHHDYKTAIQEKLQARGEAEIVYTVEKEEGPDHDKTFHVHLSYNGKLIGKGSGRSKKQAEQRAAKQAMQQEESDVF